MMADDRSPENDPLHFLHAVSLSGQDFAQRLVRSGLVGKETVQQAWKELADDERSTSGLAKALSAATKLTPFQILKVTNEPDPLLVIGSYVIQDKLGEGGMGQVFRAVHRKMKREVALKVISSRLLKDPHTIARFNREVEAAAKLSHPNIISSFDAGEFNGIHFLVMEYIVGTDLTTAVRQGGVMPPRQAVQATIQAARGLAYAHARGIVHRDIKPSNLLIDRDGVVRVLDLGLARIDQADDASVMDGLTRTGSVMGTVDYMAPEQAMDSKTADARSDIYSLGCTLFFLITGQCVYGGDTVVKRLLAHRGTPVPSLSNFNPSVPPRLDVIFKRMLAKQPESRFQSMLEVIQELEAVLPELTDTGDPQAANVSASLQPTLLSAAIDDTLAQQQPMPLISTPEIHTKPSRKRVDRSPQAQKPAVLMKRLIAAGALVVLAIVGFMTFGRPAGNTTATVQSAEPIEVATNSETINQAVASDTDVASAMSTQSIAPESGAMGSDSVSTDSERDAAEWLAQTLVSGYVRLRLPDDSLVELTPEQRTLPESPFVVEAIRFVDGQIDDPGLGHLRACRSLKELTLSRSVFASEIATDEIATDGWLSQSGQLDSLDLSGTNVTDDVLIATANQCPNLQRLDLTQDVDQSFRTLGVVAALPSLNQIGCAQHQLTSEGVAILAQHPNVTSLKIHGQVSDATINALIPLRTQLRVLVADMSVAAESPLSADAYRQLASFDMLEEITIQGIQGSPSDFDLQVVAALPQLQRVSLDFGMPVQAEMVGSGRRYTDEGLAAFRALRPDVELSADGVAHPATASFGSVTIPAIPEMAAIPAMAAAVPTAKVIELPSTLAPSDIRLAVLDQPASTALRPVQKAGEPLGVFATVPSPSRINGLLSWSVEPIRHRGGATCIDASRDGLIASGGADSTVRLWTADGKLIRILPGHLNEVASVAFSPDGKRLASVSVSPYSQIAIWDVASGNQLQALPTSNSKGRLEWSRDGTRLAHAASEVLEVYESSTWTRRQSEQFLTPSEAAWSPDGQRLFLVCHGDQHGILLDANTVEVISRRLINGSLKSVSWSTDGQFIALTSTNGVTLIRAIQSFEGFALIPYTRMYGIEFSPDGTMLAMGGDDGMKLFSTTDWQEIEIGQLSTGNDVCWSPDGERIYSLDQWYDLPSKTTFTGPTQSATTPVKLAVSSDGKRLATRTSTRLRLWDGATGQMLSERETPPSEVSQMSWQSKGNLFFQLSLPQGQGLNRLELVNGETGEQVNVLSEHTAAIWSAAWSPNGRDLASVSEDGTCRLWDVKTGRSIHTLKHGGPVWWVAWSPDGTHLATGTADNQIAVWDAKRAIQLRLFTELSGQLINPASKPMSDYPPFAFTQNPNLISFVGLDRKLQMLNVNLGTASVMEEFSLRISDKGQPDADPLGIRWMNEFRTLAVASSHRQLDLFTLGQPRGYSIPAFELPHWLDDGRRMVGGDNAHTNVVGFDLRGNRRLGTLLPELGDDTWAAISPEGHVRGSSGLGNQVAMVAMLSDGRTVTMTPQEFAARFNWKNDSSKVRFLK
jgi:serine/threonine protein kinase/WD40 repeat protein